jgi:preprotein translocase subunit SecY
VSFIESFVKSAELRKRILFTLAVLAIYRVGVHVPTPGVDSATVVKFFQAQGGIFGLFNTFTGGALEQFSIFALGIMPYISASIIFQLLQTVVPQLEQLKKEGEQGRRKITQYTRMATVILACFQGYGISSLLMSQNHEGVPLVVSSMIGFLPFRVMTIITLMAGTCLIMWLAEQITEKGIGNGASLIIFSGIAAGIPNGAARLWSIVSSGEMNGLAALMLIAFIVVFIGLIIFLEVDIRKIPVHYSARVSGRQATAPQTSYLPLKLNFSGVIPPIFASSLLVFPATLAQFIQVPWLQSIQQSLTPSGALYNVIFVSLIVFFCFFYTEIVFNPNDVAENLKKAGGFIPGIRAGKSTADYIQKVLERINVGGAAYISAICVVPTILVDKFKLPFYIGGTSVLILVGVALDTTQKIQSYLITQRYEGLMKGVKVKGRRVQF